MSSWPFFELLTGGDEAQLAREQIDDIVLVGGSTRIPYIQQSLSDFFGGKQLNKSINPDEAVAYGATIQASILAGNAAEQVQDLLLVDVTPLSLGTDIKGGLMSFIIERNTAIPIKQTRQYVTTKANQTRMNVDVREGEREIASANNLLGNFTLDGIP